MNRYIIAFIVLGSSISLGCDGDGGIEITDMQPRSGKLEGDQPVRILGNNFRKTSGYSVYFGPAKATSVTIMDDSTLVVSTPQHDRQEPVDVIIYADNGEGFRIVNGFSYDKGKSAPNPTDVESEKLRY